MTRLLDWQLRSSDLSGLHSLRTLVLSGNRLHLVDLLGGFTPFLDMLPVGNGTSGIGGPQLASLLDNQVQFHKLEQG